jgi:hypothetical protein
MKIRHVALAVSFSLLGSIGWVSPVHAAQQKNQPKPNPVVGAQTHVTQAKQAVDAATAGVKSAQAKLTKAMDHAKEVRKAVEAELDAAPELVAARTQSKQDGEAFEKLKGPILEKLQQDAGYKAALAAKEAAKKKTAKEFSDATARVKELAVSAINAVPEAKAAYAAKTESESRLQELVKKRDAAREQDKRVTGLTGEIDKAKADLAAAQTKLANARRDLGAAEQRLAQEKAKQNQSKQPVKKKR